MQSFLRNLQRFKHNTAIISQNQIYTYQQLLSDIELQRNLFDIPKQSIVGLVGDFDYQNIVNLFALALNGCIIAPLLKNSPANPSKQKIISIDFLIQNSQILPFFQPNKHSLIQKLQSLKQSGLIIFSSGSTGEPKAMLHNFDEIARTHIGKKENKINTISVFLFDHIAGIDVLLRQLSIGGTLTLPPSRTPTEICHQIQKHKVEILPAPPTFLNLIIISNAYLNYDLSSLKLISYGSEPITEALINRLKKIFPQTSFKQSFGTSETNAIKIKTENNLFIKISDPNIEYKIIDQELWIKSKTQVLGYLNAKMDSFVDGYFKTGDLVETKKINGEEFIRIIGRKKEVINVGGEKVLPQEIEGILLEMDGILDCLVYAENNPITGESVSCEVVIDENKISKEEVKKEIRKFCKGKIENFKIPSKVICKNSIESSERFKKKRKIIGGGDNTLYFFLTPSRLISQKVSLTYFDSNSIASINAFYLDQYSIYPDRSNTSIKVLFSFNALGELACKVS